MNMTTLVVDKKTYTSLVRGAKILVHPVYSQTPIEGKLKLTVESNSNREDFIVATVEGMRYTSGEMNEVQYTLDVGVILFNENGEHQRVYKLDESSKIIPSTDREISFTEVYEAEGFKLNDIILSNEHNYQSSIYREEAFKVIGIEKREDGLYRLKLLKTEYKYM